MSSGGGSYKWPLALLISILGVVIVAYPHQVWFMLKFVWDLIVLNVTPVIENIYHHFVKH